MMWFFAILIVLALGGIALVASGWGTPLAPAYDDRPDVTVPADGDVTGHDLRRVRFTLALRGYRMSEVDALLTRLADQLEAARPADDPDGPTGLEHRMAGLAEEFAAEFGPDDLDFGPASLDRLDDLLGSWGDRSRRAPAAIIGAGAYLGEVVVRHHPGTRWAKDAAFDERQVLALPSGALENPIGKAFARVENGPEDSVAFFYAALAAGERRRTDRSGADDGDGALDGPDRDG